MPKQPRKDDYGNLIEDMPKQEALDCVNRRYRLSRLNDDNTHFANINRGDDVWWFDIPLKKVEGPAAEDSLHLLLFDYRTHKVHHRQVPTLFFRENTKSKKYLSEKIRKRSIWNCRRLELVTNSFKMSSISVEVCTSHNLSNSHKQTRRAL